MNIRIGIYLLLLVMGLIVLAYPEQDDRMTIQFSETHGPSALDFIGLLILFGGYIPLIIPVVTKFSLIQEVAGKIFSRLLVVVTVIALLLIFIALVTAKEMLLWTAVGISTTTQGGSFITP
jgi:hypothetical protein